MRALAGEVDDRHLPDLVTNFGEWGPWINGGGWLAVEGRRVDWLYRDLALVRRKIEGCRAGRTAFHYQPGHPHGFCDHIYAGEVHYCLILHDENGALAELKELTRDYPPLLKKEIVQKGLWEADFALQTALKPAARGDAFYVAGCLFRCAACLVQALFALNERYLVNEKGSLAAAERLPLSPDGFAETVGVVLANSGESPKRMLQSVERLREVAASVEELCGKEAFG